MAAIMIIVAKIYDREGMREYVKATAELTERHGGRYLLRASRAILLEGAFGQDAGVLVVEWPDMEAAQGFWHSDDYAPLRETRAGKADVQVLLVDASRWMQRDNNPK